MRILFSRGVIAFPCYLFVCLFVFVCFVLLSFFLPFWLLVVVVVFLFSVFFFVLAAVPQSAEFKIQS